MNYLKLLKQNKEDLIIIREKVANLDGLNPSDMIMAQSEISQAQDQARESNTQIGIYLN